MKIELRILQKLPKRGSKHAQNAENYCHSERKEKAQQKCAARCLAILGYGFASADIADYQRNCRKRAGHEGCEYAGNESRNRRKPWVAGDGIGDA